jgi:hypothetical protein
MPKTKKHRAALLPKRAPKKTGRRGVGPRPLDDKEDFEKPTKHQLLKDAARQARLPGMEDTAIEEIETTARQYKSKQDRRIAILKEEVDLKNLLLQLLHRHGKKSYYRDGLDIQIVPTSEKVKVRFGVDKEAEEIDRADDAGEQVEVSQEEPPVEGTDDVNAF